MTNAQSLNRDVLYYFFAQMVPLAVNFVATTVFARLMGSTEYGKYIYILTTGNLLAGVFFSWIAGATLRYYFRYQAANQLTAFFITIFWSFCAVMAVVLLGGGLLIAADVITLTDEIDMGTFLLGAIVFGFAYSLRVWVLNLLRAQKASLRYTLLAIAVAVSGLIFGTLAIVGGDATFQMPLLVAIAINLLLPLVELAHQMRQSTVATLTGLWWDQGILRELLHYGLPLTVFSLGAQILAVSDRYFLGVYHTTADIGVYSVVYAIANASIVALFMILKLAIFPTLVEYHEQNDTPQIVAMMEKSIMLFFVVLLPALVGLNMLVPEIKFILGEDFQAAVGTILPLVSTGVFLFGLSQYMHIPLELAEKTRVISTITVVAALLNILLNFLLVPSRAAEGAALATLISYTFFVVVDRVVAAQYLQWRFPIGTLLKTGIACAVMAGAMMLISFEPDTVGALVASLAIKVGGGALIYGVVILLLREENALTAAGWLYQRLRKR